MVAELALGKEMLHLMRRTTTKIEDSRHLFLGAHARGLLLQTLDKVHDTITVCNHGCRVEKDAIEHLGKHGAAFIGIAQHHAHHFVVACVAEGLLECAIEKRRAKHEWMNLPLDITAVHWLLLRQDGACSDLKALE